MAYTDFQRVPGEHGLFVHDWRAVPPIAWMTRLASRETDADPLARADPAPEPGLGEEAFADAVRVALRDVTRPDRLRESPLTRTRIVRSRLAPDASPADRGRAVREAILAAAQMLERSPRDRRAFRALHHTYLQPAPTQAAAAELLDLPTTTYRRHLTAGIRPADRAPVDRRRRAETTDAKGPGPTGRSRSDRHPGRHDRAPPRARRWSRTGAVRDPAAENERARVVQRRRHRLRCRLPRRGHRFRRDLADRARDESAHRQGRPVGPEVELHRERRRRERQRADVRRVSSSTSGVSTAESARARDLDVDAAGGQGGERRLRHRGGLPGRPPPGPAPGA